MAEINIFRNARDTVDLLPGEVLFHEGDEGTTMFAVIEGEVEVTIRGTTVEVVGPGGILGELALIDRAPRTATATAQTRARLARVDHDQFVHLVQAHPTFALRVMEVMAGRLRSADRI